MHSQEAHEILYPLKTHFKWLRGRGWSSAAKTQNFIFEREKVGENPQSLNLTYSIETSCRFCPRSHQKYPFVSQRVWRLFRFCKFYALFAFQRWENQRLNSILSLRCQNFLRSYQRCSQYTCSLFLTFDIQNFAPLGFAFDMFSEGVLLCTILRACFHCAKAHSMNHCILTAQSVEIFFALAFDARVTYIVLSPTVLKAPIS